MRKREVFQYRVVEATSREAIQTSVQEFLNEGWVLVGGLCAISDSKGKKVTFYQAISNIAVEDVG